MDLQSALEPQTFLPDEAQRDELAPVLSFLEAHRDRNGDTAEPSFALVGVGAHERIELPESVYQALLRVVAALAAGKAVTVAPTSLTLTTQQAADLLGVSRPTIVRLIDNGELPAERVGDRRKLQLRDVLVYRERRRKRQYEAIAATSVDIDEDDPPEVVADLLRQARRASADQRRQRG